MVNSRKALNSRALFVAALRTLHSPSLLPSSSISPLPTPPPPRPRPPVRPRISLLAVFGMILAAIACCPFANLLGSVMGMLALQRIAMSNGALRGRRLARTAMVLGLCFAVAGSIAWWRIGTSMEQWRQDTAIAQTRNFVAAAQQGSVAGAREAWSKSSLVRFSDEALIEFGRQARDRYGPIKSFSVISAVTTSNMLSATYEAAGRFTFEGDERLGSVLLVMEPSRGFAMPVMRLQRIAIDDAERGDLTLPVAPPPATKPASTAPESAG